jgi:hypothetical protein
MTQAKMTMKMMNKMRTNVGTMNKIKEMIIQKMLLLDIFFNFPPMVHSFAYSKGGRLGIRSLKSEIQLWRFLANDWEELQEERLLHA